MPAVRLVGRPASPGLARGPVVRLAAAGSAPRVAGDPAGEDAALRAAIRTAVDALKRLALQAGEHRGGHPRLPDRHAGRRDALGRRLRGDRRRRAGAPGLARRARPGDRRLRGGATTTISAPGRPISRTSATACSTRCTGAALGRIPPGSVVFADDLTPSRFLATDWTGGAIVLSKGSPTSHVAVLARGRGVPMVVGVEDDARRARIRTRSKPIVDGAKGLILIGPDAADLDEFRILGRAAAETASRHAAVSGSSPAPPRTARRSPFTSTSPIWPSSTASTPRPATASASCGRSSCSAAGALPDEERQVAVYRRIAEWAAGKPVTIRTLDAGGDKPIPGLTEEGETNPFLGLRGVAAHAEASGPLPHAAPRARPRGRPWPRRDHGADGDRPGGAPRPPGRFSTRRSPRSPAEACRTGGRRSA